MCDDFKYKAYMSFVLLRKIPLSPSPKKEKKTKHQRSSERKSETQKMVVGVVQTPRCVTTSKLQTKQLYVPPQSRLTEVMPSAPASNLTMTHSTCRTITKRQESVHRRSFQVAIYSYTCKPFASGFPGGALAPQGTHGILDAMCRRVFACAVAPRV